MVSEAASQDFPKYEYVEDMLCSPDGFFDESFGEKYLALLKIYGEEMLEAYISEYGEKAVEWLYDEEFGGLYYGGLR